MTIESDSQKPFTRRLVEGKLVPVLSTQFFHCQICSLCTDKPLWKELSFMCIEILKLFCYFYEQNLFYFTPSGFKNEFNFYSLLYNEVQDDEIDKSLELLVERNYLIKVSNDDILTYALNTFYSLNSQLGKFDLECHFESTKRQRRLEKYSEMITGEKISDLRFNDQSCFLFNEISICGDKPLWQITSFLDNDILRLFCQSFTKGIYFFTLPVFRKEFISFSRLERKISKRSFKNQLDRLIKRGFLIKVPRYKINGSFFRLFFNSSHDAQDLELVTQILKNTKGVYDLHFDLDTTSFSFYFNRYHINLFYENLSSCNIWPTDYYESIPYPERERDSPSSQKLLSSDNSVYSKDVYALNPAMTHSLLFDVHKISHLSPIGLYPDCYRILTLLADSYPESLSIDELTEKLGKCCRVTRDRLKELESFALIGEIKPLEELKVFISKKVQEIPDWLKRLVPHDTICKIMEKPWLLSSIKGTIDNKTQYFLNYGNFLNNKDGVFF